jgi:Spy/CpxP family protein refolding chaperone
MKFVASLLALAVAFTVVGKLSADDAPAKPKHHGMAGPFEMLKGLDLTADQKAKVKEVGKEFHSKMKAAADSILTDEQKKARDEAIKSAKDAGKKGREIQKAAREAVKLTDEQKAKMKDAMKPVAKEIRDKLMAILTPEQKEQLKQKCEKKACK